MPDALAGLAASAALAVSDIPFGGPISEVRVARIDGQFVINPTLKHWNVLTWTSWLPLLMKHHDGGRRNEGSF